ncbi:MAG TPA: hypothetical protein VFH95_15770 [Candidatus Kapabacteria bacterium]|nr:hypothetical protein [Candidatus Kapabacteria bacterium]
MKIAPHEKISKNLSQPLDFIIFIAYLMGDCYGHRFANGKPQGEKFKMDSRKMKIKRIPQIHSTDFEKTQWLKRAKNDMVNEAQMRARIF